MNTRKTDFGMSRDTQLTNVAVYLMFVSVCHAKVDKLIIHANLLLDYLLKKVIFV